MHFSLRFSTLILVNHRSDLMSSHNFESERQNRNILTNKKWVARNVDRNIFRGTKYRTGFRDLFHGSKYRTRFCVDFKLGTVF